MEWYTDTLTNFEKEALRTGPINLWYVRLEDKWKEPTAVAVKLVVSARYCLQYQQLGPRGSVRSLGTGVASEL